MKIVRCEKAGKVFFGSLEGRDVVPLTGDLDNLVPDADAQTVSMDDVRLLAPIMPSKIIAIGPGYNALLQGHPAPQRPYFWIKPSTAVLDPEGAIVLPPDISVNHEAEIAIVIGKKAKNVSPGEALNHVLGYTCCVDVTGGDMSDRAAFAQSQLFVDGKIFDTFAPIGPVIVTDIDTSDLKIQLRVNGEVRQDHTTADKMFPYDELISMISRITTLLPGDIITTGSIPGVAPLQPGDKLELEIEGIGILKNHVVAGEA